MSTDPFATIPPLAPPEQGLPEHAAPGQPALKKPAIPRNLARRAQAILLPAFGIAILAWVFWPGDGRPRQRVQEAAPAAIDHAKQVQDTNALLNALKAQGAARSEPEPAAAAAPGVPAPLPAAAGSAGAGPGLPLPSAHAARLPAGPDSLEREEEIRASALDVNGSVVLMGESGAAFAANPASPLAQVQQELARLTGGRDARAADPAELLAKSLAGISGAAQQGSVRPPSAGNAEFLGANTGPAAGPALQQQRAAPGYWLMEGTVIRAVLLTSVSSDLPGDIQARVVSDVYDSVHKKTLLIPQGSVLLGKYNSETVIGQEALMVAMTRLILPDGSWIALSGAPGLAPQGQSGLKADVNTHFWKMFRSSLIVGATSMLLPKSQTTVQTTPTGNGSVTTGSVAATALNETVNTLMQRNRNIRETLSVGMGSPFLFMISRDVSMEPYRN